jgi:ubiquinone/menaquinone biosynthesis C-methylase UbiE/rubredoxin
MCNFPVSESKVLGKRLNKSQKIRAVKKIGITTTIMQCNHCGLIYANPMPVPESIAQHYGIPPESYWEQTYFNINQDYFKEQIETFFRLYDKKDDLLALDIGAGLGKSMIALQRAGFEVYGIEASEQFYNRAINKMGISPKKLILSTLEEAEYNNNQFDFITFGAVLEHLYNPSEAILKAIKWLKPNGLVHIEVPSSKWLTSRIVNLIYKIQGLDYVTNLSPMHPPFHLYEFGLKSFQEHARLHDYTIAFHKYMVCSTYLPKIIEPVVKPIMEKTNTGMQLEVFCKKTVTN